MRLLFTAIWLVSVQYCTAQVNRSARELAAENIRDHVQHKLFAGRKYEDVSFGELQKFTSNRKTDIEWSITHEFVLKNGNTGDEVQYRFIFYLDRKMNVRLSESYRKD